ncbi:MAG: PAS domain-containing protein [Bryobacteraceae bacterium]
MDSVWSGNVWTGEFPVSHRDGSSVPARVRLFPVFDATRRVAAIVGVSENISAEIAARNALRHNREFLDLLARSTSDAVWDWDVVTGAVRGNAAYDALVGPPSPGQSARDAWLARIHPDDLTALMAQSAASENAGSSFSNEYRFLNYTTNSYARIRDRGFFARDADGKLRRVVGAMADISHLKDIEQAFRASEERFRLVFEESPLGIIIFDRSFQIL